MAAFRRFEAFVIRYVPDLIKGEFLNVGVGLRCVDDGDEMLIRWDDSLQYIHCRHPNADLAYLETEQIPRFASEICHIIDPLSAQRNRIPSEYDPFLIAALSPIQTDNPEAEIDRLRASVVKTAKKKTLARARPRGRNVLLMRGDEAFERVGVLQLLGRNVSAAKYTWPTDRLKLDYVYRANGVVKCFQTVPRRTYAPVSKSLLISYPALRQGVTTIEQADTELTAIVEDELDQNEREIAGALSALRASGIEIAAASRLSDIAETARQDLRP